MSINNYPPLLPSALHIPDFNSTVADNVYHDGSHIPRAHSRLLPLSSLSKDVLTQLTAKLHSNGETRNITREMIAVCHNSMDPEGLARILMQMSPEELMLTALKCKWGVDDWLSRKPRPPTARSRAANNKTKARDGGKCVVTNNRNSIEVPQLFPLSGSSTETYLRPRRVRRHRPLRPSTATAPRTNHLRLKPNLLHLLTLFSSPDTANRVSTYLATIPTNQLRITTTDCDSKSKTSCAPRSLRASRTPRTRTGRFENLITLNHELYNFWAKGEIVIEPCGPDPVADLFRRHAVWNAAKDNDGGDTESAGKRDDEPLLYHYDVWVSWVTAHYFQGSKENAEDKTVQEKGEGEGEEEGEEEGMGNEIQVLEPTSFMAKGEVYRTKACDPKLQLSWLTIGPKPKPKGSDGEAPDNSSPSNIDPDSNDVNHDDLQTTQLPPPPSGLRITLSTPDPVNAPLPHPHLLWLHAGLSRLVRAAGGAGDRIEDEALEEEYIGPSMVDFEEGRLVWDGEGVVECGEFMEVNRGKVEGWLEGLRMSKQIDADHTPTPQSSPTGISSSPTGNLLRYTLRHGALQKQPQLPREARHRIE